MVVLSAQEQCDLAFVALNKRVSDLIIRVAQLEEELRQHRQDYSAHKV